MEIYLKRKKIHGPNIRPKTVYGPEALAYLDDWMNGENEKLRQTTIIL